MDDVVMGLTLSVLSYHRFTSDLEARKSFPVNDKVRSYSIGRSAQCDWCLPDPERVISAKHALIQCHADKFTIIDLSTNGIFINRSIEALGVNNSRELSNGDLLTLGDYEIEVSLTETVNKTDNNVYSVNSGGDIASNDVLNHHSHFGIPAIQRNQSEVKEEALDLPSQTLLANASRPEFAGSLEDSFMVAVDEPCDFNDIGGELTIPEDWSEGLGSSAYDRTDFEATQQNNEDKVSTASTTTAESDSKVMIAQAVTEPTDHSSPMSQAFVRGLGINPNMVPADSEDQWWFELGLAMQHLMTGLMDTLHHRSEFKQNSRLNQTLFKKQENNPLKFSATVEDAIHNLFNRNNTSFLSADRAIKEAYSDIEKHERALLAGVEGTVAGLMKLVSPDSISARDMKHHFWQRLTPSYSKSANWDTYKAMYQRLERDMEGANKAFYLDDFVKAYEAYLKGAK